MKRLSLIMGIISLLLFVTVGVVSMPTNAHAKPTAMPHSCNAAVQIFPGDGYSDPSFGTNGHEPALIYMDNGDGTFTDCNTKYMWEKKLKSDGTDGGSCTDGTQSNRSVHCVNNLYAWTAGTTASDGSLFTVFLDILNNKCDGNETTPCTTDADCTGIGNGLCGLAGYGDWCIPNVKVLQSIVNYNVFNPSSSVPGATRASNYWSSTTFADGPNDAWGVSFGSGGFVFGALKSNSFFARAVRPCS